MRIKANGLSIDWSAITPEFVAKAHSLGMTVYSFAPDKERDPERLAVPDGVITSVPSAHLARGAFALN